MLNFCSAFVSILMLIAYILADSNASHISVKDHCVVADKEFAPLIYTSADQHTSFLESPGVNDVTSHWQLILRYGLISNAIVIGFAALNMCCNKMNCASSHAFIWIGITLQQLVQFIMLLVFRFSHGGRVCSGDYLKEITTNSDFYMIGLGKFLFIYSITWIAITGVFVSIMLCCGCCMFHQN